LSDADPPTTETLGALAGKYRTLADWRARREGGAAATRDELRALAAAFPGCLRELDTLGGPELERRAAACSTAAAGGASEPWMAWIAAYHALMRAAWRVRAGGDPDPDPDLPPGFAAAVRRPPGGRVSVAVIRTLGARFGVPAASIAAALFPVRRPSPYQL
jgi:hypothetical protein